MNLTTNYMGLKLKNPIVPSASPLSEYVDKVKKMEDAGAAAIVMYSLFEEQIRGEKNKDFSTYYDQKIYNTPYSTKSINQDVENYLEHIAKLKKAIDIPIIASLNGTSAGWWIECAKHLQSAGADALELNMYYIPTDPYIDASEIENVYLENLRRVKNSVDIPVAIKLNPYFSAFANIATRLSKMGADALVLFNRFYQPDIDLDRMEIIHSLELSKSNEIRLPLRWAAILYGKVSSSLAITTGVHTAEDVIKSILVGADVAMMTSVLLQEGIETITKFVKEIEKWMLEHEYNSLSEIKGSMSYQAVKEPGLLVRANYIKTLEKNSEEMPVFWQ